MVEIGWCTFGKFSHVNGGDTCSVLLCDLDRNWVSLGALAKLIGSLKESATGVCFD